LQAELQDFDHCSDLHDGEGSVLVSAMLPGPNKFYGDLLLKNYSYEIW